MAALLVATTVLFSAPSCKALRRLDGQPEMPQKLALESCEDARQHPDQITWDDVRWVDCARPVTTSKAEAFTLADPVYIPLQGPVPQDAHWYSANSCEHGGGSIAAFNLWYKREDLASAIGCSRRRCDAGDALGCRDLGALNWDDLYPGVIKNPVAALAAFEAGCRLRDSASCFSLAQLHRDRGERGEGLRDLVSACENDRPVTLACEEAGKQYLVDGREPAAKALLLRACRGTTTQSNPFAAHRDGCDLLAALARKAGDQSSVREYLRLACAYGGSPSSCQELGLILLKDGDKRRATPYLRKACGILPDSQQLFRPACQAIAE